MITSLIFAFLLNISLHPIHNSLTEISYSKKEREMQFVLKLHTDDLDKALLENYQYKSAFSLSKMPANDVQMAEKYIKTVFEISINNKRNNQFIFIGNEIDKGEIQFYFHLKNIKENSKVKCCNKIMFDLFEDQINIINLLKDGKKKSYLTSSKLTCIDFEIK